MNDAKKNGIALSIIKILHLISPTLLVAMLVIIWEVIVVTLDIPTFLLPKPSKIITSIFAEHSLILKNTYVTITEALGGSVIAAFSGLLLAVTLALSNSTRRALEPIISGFQSFPKEAIAPVLIVWFGFGYESKVILAASIAFFPIFVGCLEGIRSVPTDIITVMTAMRASRYELLTKVQLPYALPSIISGMRVAWTLSIIGAVISEFVGASEGLGHLILLANSQFDISLVFSALLVLAFMGFIGDYIIKIIGARCTPWYGVGTVRADVWREKKLI